MDPLQKALVEFIKMGNLAAIKQLIGAKLFLLKAPNSTDSQTSLCCSDEQGRGLMHHAIEAGQLDVCLFLFELLPPAALHIVTTQGKTTLMAAAEQGWLEVVKRLIAAGIKVDAVDSKRCSALALAATQGNQAIVEELVNNLLSVSNTTFEKLHEQPSFFDDEGTTPMHLAAAQGHVEIVRYFLANRFLINLINFKSATPLLLACANQKLEVCKLLIANDNTNLDATNIENESPLYSAVNLYDVEITKLLLEAGAKCYGDYKTKVNLLSAAITNHSSRIISLLFRYGAAIGQDLPEEMLPLIPQIPPGRFWLIGTKIKGKPVVDHFPAAIVRLVGTDQNDLSLPGQEQNVLACCKLALERSSLNNRDRHDLETLIKTRRLASSLKNHIIAKINEPTFYDQMLQLAPNVSKYIAALPHELQEQLLKNELQPEPILIHSVETLTILQRRQLQFENLSKGYSELLQLRDALEEKFYKNRIKAQAVICCVPLSLAVFACACLLLPLVIKGSISIIPLVFGIVALILTVTVAFSFIVYPGVFEIYNFIISRMTLDLNALSHIEALRQWIGLIITELRSSTSNNVVLTDALAEWQTIEQALHAHQGKELITDIKQTLKRIQTDKLLIHTEAMEHQRFYSSYDHPLFFRPASVQIVESNQAATELTVSDLEPIDRTATEYSSSLV